MARHTVLSGKSRLILLLTIFCGIAFSQQAQQKEIQRIAETLFAENLSPGMAVVVVKDNNILFMEGFGYQDIETRQPVTPQSTFYIASVTKTLTALAAAVLHNEGKLDLDKPISQYLPDLKLHHDISGDEITIRDLLTHTHGIGGGPVTFRTAYSGEFTSEQLFNLMQYHAPSRSGRNYNYGNIGYNVTGFALEAHFNKSWKDIVAETVLHPLGMENTSARMFEANKALLAQPHFPTESSFQKLYYAKGDANMHAAGGHITSVEDYAKLLLVQLNSGELNGETIFPAKVIEDTHRRQAIQDRNFSLFHRHGWGLGWDLGTYEGDTLIHRFGSFIGFRPHTSFMPQHRIGVVVLVNELFLGGRLADYTAAIIYDYLLNKPNFEERLSKSVRELKETNENIRSMLKNQAEAALARKAPLQLPESSYEGVYQNEKLGTMTWKWNGETFEVRMGLMVDTPEIYDADSHQFRIDWTGRGRILSFQVVNQKVVGLTFRDEVFNRVGK